MSLADTLRSDAAALLDAITFADAGLTVRELTTATGLNKGRTREGLSFLLGAGDVSCAMEPERGGMGHRGRCPAQVWRVASGDGAHWQTWVRPVKGEIPGFDHVYAAIEDAVDELAEIRPRLPRALRNSVEFCQVWLDRAIALIDGEAD